MEWILLAVAIGLVIACGYFVAAEFAFVTVDRNAVAQAIATGDRRARGVDKALRHLSTQLSGAQVGITITNLAIGFLAEPAIAALIAGPLTSLGVPESAVSPVAIAIGLVAATVVTMIFGELVPKNLAIADPLRTARLTQGFQRFFTHVTAWPIRALNGSANAVLRALGVEPQEELRSARTSQELASLAIRSAMAGTLDEGTARLVQRSVGLGPRTAEEIMTPRVRMVSIPADSPMLTAIELAKATGHSRFPVVDGDADDVVGVVHVKQAVAVRRSERQRELIRDHMVAPVVVPETLGLESLLGQLREEGFQLAIVADEYGGTAGIVTLEDVIEELVGNISDEHDRLGVQVRRRRDGAWSVSGLLRPDEVTDGTGIALPEADDYETVAGLFLLYSGHIPTRGDQVFVPGVDASRNVAPVPDTVLTIERMDGLRIDRLIVSQRTPERRLTGGAGV